MLRVSEDIAFCDGETERAMCFNMLCERGASDMTSVCLKGEGRSQMACECVRLNRKSPALARPSPGHKRAPTPLNLHYMNQEKVKGGRKEGRERDGGKQIKVQNKNVN